MTTTEIKIVTIPFSQLREMIENQFEKIEQRITERERMHELDKRAIRAFSVSFGDSLDKSKTARLLDHSRVTVDKLLYQGVLEQHGKGVSVQSVISYLKENKPELLESCLRRFDEGALVV